ncbi:capsid protein of prophage [Escherichia coli]|uniref:Capsid protein of prophage n=1 Tax=Escherichia coli TaxID=562 RepID=A0A376U7U2_ECOLX|nr:capsid protein of prophage [Escherichia coli]
MTLGGVKIPHLFPGDDLKLQTAQDSDNGFSALEQALLRYIAAGLGVSYEQLSRDYSKVSYSSARASANESWRYFMGRRKFIASRLATQMFPAGWKRHFFGGLFVRHGHVLIFIRRDQPGHGLSGLEPEEWPLTGSRRFRNQ